MRYFEKITFEQFKKDVSDDRELYDSYELPRRGSKNSCGYDFLAINNIILHPGEIIKIPTGYKARFMEDEALLLVVRSSILLVLPHTLLSFNKTFWSFRKYKSIYFEYSDIHKRANHFEYRFLKFH